jgi:purine-binding chemotaxis protein CheW
MSQEHLFASFVLDREQDLEIALKAEQVAEATTVQGTLRKLPGSIDFLEGIMHLRNDVIPVINLKKRLGLAHSDYDPAAKVAVVSLHNQRFGLLFDDIREVFRATSSAITPISKALQTSDRVIASLIKLDEGRRAVELLDLKYLFNDDLADLDQSITESRQQVQSGPPVTYQRCVVFCCAGQQYGIPVECAQEITFCTDIDTMFQTGVIEGALELRGKTVPILNSRSLLTDEAAETGRVGEDTRILILSSDDCAIGLIVDEIRDIVTIASDQVLPFPSGRDENVKGLFPRPTGENVILLDIHRLVCDQIDSIKSMAKIGSGTNKGTGAQAEKSEARQRTSHHLITENCYLVFAIGKHYAIELKDVREIIENTGSMRVPGASGYSTGVINLRGEVVPVVNLRSFYHYPQRTGSDTDKLIICSGHGTTVALRVDQIVTIYKQEQYHSTPSLNPQLSDRQDTLDRLIEYLSPDGLKEHVLVVNTHNLIRNHLQGEPRNHAVPEEKLDDFS